MPNKTHTSREKVLVQSVDRALNILALFRQHSSLKLTEIADRMGLAKSTVYGLVSTLEAHGYLEQDPETGEYQLGVKLLEMGGYFEKRLSLRREAHSVMKSLVEKYGETVQLSILDGREVVYIDLVEAPTSIRYAARIGMRAPAHCTATGKVMLADLSESLLDKLYGDGLLPTTTPRSISSLVALKEHLKMVREQGYSLDDEESEVGVRGVAAGIRNRHGRVIAGISLGGPASRVTYEIVPELARAVIEAAATISERLGYKQTGE